MELVVISPEGERADEIAAVEQFRAAGLRRYHVRKPGWSAERLGAWLAKVPPAVRARMVLHSHHELVEKYGLLGRHWRDEPGLPASAPQARGFASCACHSLEDLRTRAGGYDAIFFSPVFESESKPGRDALTRQEMEAVEQFLKGRAPTARSLPVDVASAGGPISTLHLSQRPALSAAPAALESKAAAFGVVGSPDGASPNDEFGAVDGRPRTKVFALSGVTPERVRQCAEMGFDGVAVMGGIWSGVEAATPPLLAAFREYLRATRRALPAIMCLTQDGGAGFSHVEQAQQLCAAGARFIQLRMKGAPDDDWLQTAREAVAICRAYGATCIVNDRADLAVAAGADGAHVGKNDGDWREARRILGPDKLLGGTVNDEDDARRAVAAGCLDYVGVGPLRFTATKQKLAPILGEAGIARVIAALDGLPAWAIGGVQSADLPGLKAIGADGVAVTSGLYRDGEIKRNFDLYAGAWAGSSPSAQKKASTVQSNLIRRIGSGSLPGFRERQTSLSVP